MTSNGDAAVNTHPRSLDDPTPPNLPSPSAAAQSSRATSPAPLPELPPSTSNQPHGDSDDGANESEAETVVLEGREPASDPQQAIKIEQTDDGLLRDTHDASRTPNGRSSMTAQPKDTSTDHAKAASSQDAKSSVPPSPSGPSASRVVKETSPALSSKSRVEPTTSPSLPTQRGRSASTAESRKRKQRDDSSFPSLEPPRQKAKTEGLKESRIPAVSPSLASHSRLHKRSQSTQSVSHSGPGRKRKDLTALTLNTENRVWSESSSERSSSPRPLHTPGLLSHTRRKRSNRALTSPARAMTKRNVDKFGATRLARESEKGDLQAVKAAYEAAPEELDQDDFAGITPVQKAALHGWYDVVEFLLGKGCRADCESHDRDTPLIDAVENGHLDVVKLLLDQAHVNPHHQNKKGQRAIDVLDPEGDDAEEIERVLQEAMTQHTMRTDTLNSDDYPQPSVHPGNTVSRLLYNEYNIETLIERAGVGDMAAVGELLNSNIKPNIACGVAASRGGHYDILSILLASGLKADPDPAKHTDTPMSVAIGRGHLKVVKLLLEQESFNPTRRNREGKTYFELSDERKGPKWEQEREILKDAYDEYLRTHKSPRRVKKEPPSSSAVRTKRKSSPSRRERSSSPRHEPKRLKPSTGQPPQKSRRLMSGKEMANREVKRRRPVVSDDSSDDSTDDEKPRASSEGIDPKRLKKHPKTHHNGHPVAKRQERARSDDSDHDGQAKRRPKIRTQVEKVVPARPTPTGDDDSPDERKTTSKMVKPKSRVLEDKVVNDRPPDVTTDDAKIRKASIASTKPIPAPHENGSSVPSGRERGEEVERKAESAQSKKLGSEAVRGPESTRRDQESESRRKAMEEEARRKSEAEAKRRAEEAEAMRKREAEERKRKLDEEETKRQEETARLTRLSQLPRALRHACETGVDRPLYFSGEQLGISAIFLPLFFATGHDLRTTGDTFDLHKSYIMSFQAVGILGLPELDLARLPSPYCDWERISVDRKHKESLLRQYDVALLAQDYRFPAEGTPEFEYAKIQESTKEARDQFLDLDCLYWIEASVLTAEVQKSAALRPLLKEITDSTRWRRIDLVEADWDATPGKRIRPRKSFLNLVARSAFSRSGDTPTTNGDG
ncbi:hypothetical protein M011DRAFT_495731 [Sporormia fimetaria CBS 119925]|uniref:Ankyrin n=1 Tax=Sporormia fimetaria CBS 119925 TaxID=1340428 RepID=A0A6A6V5D0_9PLEO|nr:hypothetical protein M011DRAFT_495731 [Sporormia fimetaria CBS 119925]